MSYATMIVTAKHILPDTLTEDELATEIVELLARAKVGNKCRAYFDRNKREATYTIAIRGYEEFFRAKILVHEYLKNKFDFHLEADFEYGDAVEL